MMRDWLRNIVPVESDPKYLQWDPLLDNEDGKGVRIGLVDSGIFWEHMVFNGANIQGMDFTSSGGLGDPSGHGTRNASILLAQGHGGFRGICPGSELLFGKALSGNNRTLSVSAIARSIRWIVNKTVDILVLPFGTCRGNAVIAREIHRAVRLRCTVIAAAGNHGPDKLHFPAWLPGVKSVTGVGIDGKPLSLCCAMKEIDLFAPGSDVPAIGLEGRTKITGSSPAAVIAAGLMALWLGHKRSIDLQS